MVKKKKYKKSDLLRQLREYEYKREYKREYKGVADRRESRRREKRIKSKTSKVGG